LSAVPLFNDIDDLPQNGLSIIGVPKDTFEKLPKPDENIITNEKQYNLYLKPQNNNNSYTDSKSQGKKIKIYFFEIFIHLFIVYS
jgi:hypothetical protein